MYFVHAVLCFYVLVHKHYFYYISILELWKMREEEAVRKKKRRDFQIKLLK
jgi:hypothetical protein